MKTITIGTFALAAAFTVGGCSSHSKAYNQGYSVGYQVGAEVPGQGSPFYEGQPDQRTIAVYCDSGEQFSENPYGQDPAQSDWYDGWDAGCHDGMVAPEP